MSTEVNLQLVGALDIPDVDAGFEVDLRLAGGPFALILRPTATISLEQVWDIIRNQVRDCFHVSLPALDGGPWKKLLDTQIRPSVWITPTSAQGLSVFLDLDYVDPVSIGVDPIHWGPVTIQIEPNLTIHGLMVGYDAKAGLNFSARVSYDTDKGKAGGSGKGSVTKVVEYPFPVPAQQSQAKFQVHYLGIGQRVGPEPITNPAVTDPLAAIFDELEATFDTNDPEEVLTRLANTFYHPDRGWFIAADLQYKAFRIRVLFNDPTLYGLEITVGDDPPSFLSGLLFEILYQKLGPKLGVYYGALTLPETMRRIPMEGFILILPGFSIWVYTNGDFRVNIGWPVGPNSIGVSVDVLTGWAGFYFAKLRSGDNPDANPSVNFNPILQFGIGFQLTAGVSFSAGPLSASLGVTATTTMQGLLAWKDGAGGSSVAGPPDAYWFAGTFSLQVLIQGSVDFVVIKATVLISFGVQAQVAFENGYKTLIAVQAHVEVRASIKVVFVRIHFSFHTTVHHSFTIGSGAGVASVSGPQQSGLTGFTAAAELKADVVSDHVDAAGRMRTALAPRTLRAPAPLEPPPRLTGQRPAVQAYEDAQDSAPLVEQGAQAVSMATGSPASGPSIEVHFALQPTVIYDETAGTIGVVGLLLTDSPAPKESPAPSGTPPATGTASPETGTGFESLVAHLVCWLLGLPELAPLRKQPLSEQLQRLQQLLGQGGAPPGPPFHDAIGFGEAVTAYFESNLTFRLVGTTDLAHEPTITGTVLPVFPELEMSVDGGTAIAFETTNPTPSNYAEAVSAYFDGLGLMGPQAAAGNPHALHTESSPLVGPSVARFVFADYYLMLMRQAVSDLLRDALAYEKAHQESLFEASGGAAEPHYQALAEQVGATDPQEELDQLLEAYDYGNLSGMAARFLLGGVQLPVPDQVPAGNLTPDQARRLPTEALYRLTGQQATVGPVGSPPQATAVLQAGPGQSVPWIEFGTSGATSVSSSILVPAGSLPAAPAPAWLGTGLTSLLGADTSPDGTIAYVPMPPLVPVDLAMTTRTQTAWSTPSGALIVVPLPAPLLAMTARAALAVNAHLATKTVDRTFAGSMPDGAGSSALAFEIPITQVENAAFADISGSPGSTSPAAGSPAATGPVPFLYQVGATDDDSRERLHQILDGPLPVVSVSILYSGGDTLRSDELGPEVLISRTNLSTKNQAKEVALVHALRLLAAPAPDNEDYALLSDTTGFLRLLWEVSVVNAEGFYLYYRTLDGQGLPDALFQDTAPDSSGQGQGSVPESGGLQATLTIVVELAAATTPDAQQPIPLPAPANSVLLDGSVFGGKTVSLEVLDMVAGSGGQAPTYSPAQGYHPAYAAGDLGFRLDWTGRPEGDVSPPAIPVLDLYHLVEFRIETTGGPASPALEAWSLPLNPMSPDSGASSPESPASPDDDADVFQQVFPAYRFLNAPSSPVTSPLVSPQGATAYDLIGQTVSLGFRLVDVFGNALHQQASASQVGVYNDPIINLGQWPYVHSGQFFQRGANDVAELVVTLRFDTAALSDLSGSPSSPSSPSGGSSKSAIEAVADRFTAIALQLADPGTTFSLETSLTQGRSLDDPRAELIAFVDAIRGAIAALLVAADTHSAQPVSAMLSAPVPNSDIADMTANIGPVTVTLAASRDPSQAAPDAATRLPDVITNTYRIPPLRTLQDGGSPITPSSPTSPDDPSGKSSVAAYAHRFERAFADFDDAGGSLKLAERAGVVATHASAEVETLWYVRFRGADGSPASPGIHTQFTGRLTYYALMPLNTAPITRLVDSLGKRFNGIDMDAWAATFFRTVDDLFAPRLATAIVLLDERNGTTCYQTLCSAKQTLAKTVPTGLRLVLEGDETGDLTAAADGLQQAMLDRLASAFTISVIAQAEADVEAIGQADTTSPTSRAPELYGKVGVPTGGSPSESMAQAGSDTTKVFTMSPARLEVASGTQWVSSLVSVAQPDEHVNLTMPLAYDISYAQHDFETSETHDGYTPSSWIKFVLPGEPPLALPITTEASPAGEAIIPIPLPFEPTAPALSAQTGSASNTGFSPDSPNEDRLSAIMRDALLWTYRAELSSRLAAQDVLYVTLTFNGEADGRAAISATGVQLDPLFDALATFLDVAPALDAALPELLAEAYASGSPTGTPPGDALATLQTAVDRIQDVSTAWPDRSHQLTTLTSTGELDSVEYQLDMQPVGEDVVLTLTARRPGAPPQERPTLWPTVTSPGRDLDWTPDPAKAAPASDGWWTLSHTVAASSISQALGFEWVDLDLRQRQSADFECYVVRNAELVPGRKTVEDFVYETSLVRFTTPQIPLITRTDLPVIPAQDSLQTMLEEILAPLAPKTGLSPVLNFRADFTFALAGSGDDAIVADVPILVLDDQSLTGSPPPMELAADLAAAIASWHETFLGPRTQLLLDFTITLFGTVEGQQLPLVHLDPIRIDVTETQADWWTGTSA